MFKEFCKIVKESLQDNATGRYSHSRVIAMLVAIFSTMLIIKLTWGGGLTIDYFIAYLSFGVGHQSLNKFLDNKDSSRSAEATKRIQSSHVTPAEDNDEYSAKPPKP